MKYVFSFILFLINSYSFAQKQSNTDKNTIPANRGDTIEILKQMSFCSCINKGFANDSLETKDPSIYVLLETIGGSFDLLDSINRYTEKIILQLPLTKKGQNRENTAKKRVTKGCIEMYRSKLLGYFLKRLYSKNRFLFPKG